MIIFINETPDDAELFHDIKKTSLMQCNSHSEFTNVIVHGEVSYLPIIWSVHLSSTTLTNW